MLADNFSSIGLLLCMVIARNYVVSLDNSTISKTSEKTEVTDIPAVPAVPVVPAVTEASTVVPAASQVVQTSATPIKPRIIQRTTVLKRANRFRHQENSTSTWKPRNYKEDDITSTTNLPGPVSFVSTTSKTLDFRPSIHLGEIDGYETRKSSINPFNKLQHVRFENSVSIGESDTDRAPGAPTLVDSTSTSLREAEQTATVEARKKNNRVKFFETDSRYGVAVPVEVAHQQQQYYTPQQHNEQHEETNNNNEGDEDNSDGYNYPMKMPVGLVTFVYPQSHYGEVTARPMTFGRPVYPSMTNEQVHVQPQYEAGMDNVQTFYVKPSKFHGEVEIVTPLPIPAPIQIQNYEHVTPASGEAMDKPEIVHHQDTYQVVPHETDMNSMQKPETVLYLTSHRETAYTRTRPFPYQFYHPGLGHQDNEYHFVQEGPHHFPSKARRISPWKKILHLIGTFLPLGLLLATLTPNVVKIGNNTQPSNILLSKLRVVDLPVEHKRGRLVDELDNQQQNTCEDRSICELIVSGSEPRSNLLQNILWNLTTKSSDEEAKKHGLHEIFAAVKRKDCSTIDC